MNMEGVHVCTIQFWAECVGILWFLHLLAGWFGRAAPSFSFGEAGAGGRGRVGLSRGSVFFWLGWSFPNFILELWLNVILLSAEVFSHQANIA